MASTNRQLSDSYGTLAYRERGQGMPVVLIHRVGLQSVAWHPQIDALSQTHSVIAVDMPGHGGVRMLNCRILWLG